MPVSVPPFSLAGRSVRLLPLSLDHVDDLVAAATDDRSTFGHSPVPWDRPSMERYVERALEHRAAGEQYPFATWSAQLGRVVGSTRFYDLTRWDRGAVYPWSPAPPEDPTRVADATNIGYTWLHPAVQRTAVNTEAKLLMLAHAFECFRVRVVRLKTDARNARSRAAIARLGCSLDGVLRAERLAPDGSARDSAYYSMLSTEWLARRRRLLERLA